MIIISTVSSRQVACVYICICNALTEKQVDDAIANGADSTGRVYEHHRCAVRCGKCVREVAERLQGSQPRSQTGLPVMLEANI